MIVTVFNKKYDDSIQFEVDEIDEHTKKYILSEVHSRGWEDKNCWSEVE
jgi:hypothetical protein